MKKALALLIVTALSVLAQVPKPSGSGGGSGGGGSVTINAPTSGNEVVKNGTGSSFDQRGIVGGTGLTCTEGTDDITCAPDTAVVPLWSAGSGAPSANCTAGATYYLDSTAQSIYFCSATNTWKLVSNTVFALADTGGDDTYGNSTACSGFPATYASGQTVILQATTANTGAATLDCGPGAKAIKLVDGSTDPANGNITSKRPAILQYDAAADSGSGAWLLKTIAAIDIDAADKAGTDSKVVTAAAKGTAGNCAEWTATGLGDAGFACSSGGGGGGAVADPYVVTVSAQTTLTVTAATHGQGISPIAQCFDNSTPRIAVACSYSKATDGQIVFTWSPAFTGQVVIMSAGGGDELTTIRAVTGTTDTVLDADCGGMVTYSNASSIAVTLPQAGASSEFVTGCTIRLLNKGAGTVTVTPTTSTIGGAASVALGTGEWLDAVSDGTNYEISATNRATAGDNITLTKARTGVTVASNPSGTNSTCFQLETGGTGPKLCDESNGLQIKTSADAVMATLTTAGVLTLGDGTAPWNLTGLTDDVAPGAPGSANQFTSYIDRTTGLFNYHLNGDANPKVPALGKWATFTGPTAARSYALPDADATIPRTIYSGTKALDTDAIASETCDTLTAVTATGVVSTDIVTFTPNADITAVTGYAPVTAGGLTIYAWPSTDAINIKVCNPTSSSITPGAVTLNLRVTR